MKRFEGKVVFVTGAASGIGEATARRFSSEGASVALVDRNEVPLAKVAKELPAQLVPSVSDGPRPWHSARTAILRPCDPHLLDVVTGAEVGTAQRFQFVNLTLVGAIQFGRQRRLQLAARDHGF